MKMKQLLIVAIATVATVSQAQDSSPVRLDIRAGVQFPISADLSGMFYGIGLDFNFTKSLLPNSETYISVDWITKNTTGNRNSMFPILLNQRWHLAMKDTGNDRPMSTYAFAGVGLAILDFGSSATVLAGRAGLGANFNESIFGEVALVLTSRAKGTSIQGNHIGLYLGYRL